jgi:hypothetical protein
MAAKGTVRLYLGTRKGAYIVESDRARKKWKVKGPFHEGRDVYHLAPDPRHEGTVYAAVNSSWWGPMLMKSTNGGGKWTELAPPNMPLTKERPPPGSPEAEKEKRPITNLWHIEPGSVDEPNTVFLGVDPASLYRSENGGKSWEGVRGINEHETRPKWNPGAGGMCLHTILLDPTRPKRLYVGISAAGTFRSDDGGEHFRPVNKGVLISFLPKKNPPFGQCVHKVARDPSDPDTFYRQDHDGIYVSHDAMESWKHVGAPLHDDFGFVVTAPESMPGNAFFAPLNSQGAMPRTFSKHQIQVYRWNDRAGKFSPTIRGNPWPGDIGTHRDAMASDRLDPAGIYLGTTTGQLFFTNDGAQNWGQVPYLFPGIHAVVATPPPA